MALPWSCYCAVLQLVQTAVLCSHIPPASAGPSRSLQWFDEDAKESSFLPSQRWRRDLEYYEENGDDDDDDRGNCSKIENPLPYPYNNTCEFVKEECESLFELFNYLRFVTCTSIGKVYNTRIYYIHSYCMLLAWEGGEERVLQVSASVSVTVLVFFQPAGFIFLCLWLAYLLLLLSTTVSHITYTLSLPHCTLYIQSMTLYSVILIVLPSLKVDKFFVPVLQLLAAKLRLPASIAGMTLLALGNGISDCIMFMLKHEQGRK